MSLPIPQQPSLKSAGDLDYNSLLRFFATKKLRATLSSPPLAKDIGELELYIDKDAARIYTKINGSLKYVALT